MDSPGGTQQHLRSRQDGRAARLEDQKGRRPRRLPQRPIARRRVDLGPATQSMGIVGNRPTWSCMETLSGSVWSQTEPQMVVR